MLERLKENGFVCFTLSLVASYFTCYGYYSFFHIDITSFLSINDLTMIFAKWIWFSAFVTLLSIAVITKIFKQMENKESWWDKSIGRTIYKRRALIVFPIIIAIIISAFTFEIASIVLTTLVGIGLVTMFIIALVYIAISSLKNKKELAEIPLNEWIVLFIVISVLIYIVPFIGGNIFASNAKVDKIYVVFDDNKKINTVDSVAIIYIGKTSEYFFTTNLNTKNTTAYRMDKVKSFEVMIDE